VAVGLETGAMYYATLAIAALEARVVLAAGMDVLDGRDRGGVESMVSPDKRVSTGESRPVTMTLSPQVATGEAWASGPLRHRVLNPGGA